MVFVLTDIALDIRLIDAVRSDGILKILGKENGLAGVSTHLIIVVHEVYCVAVSVCSAVMPVVDHIIKQIEAADGTVVAVHTATHAPITTLAVHQQVVVP